MVAAVAISVCSSRQKFVDLGRAALSAKKSDSFAMTTPPQPQKRYDSPNVAITLLYRCGDGNTRNSSLCVSSRPSGPCRPWL
jgi:hypothetical protein